MTVFESWLAKLDISSLGLNVLVWVLVLGAGWFVNKKVWPWFTTDFFPSRIKRDTMRFEAQTAAEKQRSEVLINIRDSLVALNTIAQQQMLTLREHGHQLNTLLGRAERSADAVLPVQPAEVKT